MCRTSASKPMAQFRAPLAPLLGPLPTGHTAAPTTRLRSGRHPVTWPLAAPTRDTLRHGTSGGQWLGPRPHHAGNTRAAHTPNRWLKFLHERGRRGPGRRGHSALGTGMAMADARLPHLTSLEAIRHRVSRAARWRHQPSRTKAPPLQARTLDRADRAIAHRSSMTAVAAASASACAARI